MDSKYLDNKIEEIFNRNSLIGNDISLTSFEFQELEKDVLDIFQANLSEDNSPITFVQQEKIFYLIVQYTKKWNKDDNSWLGFLSKKIYGTSVKESKLYGILCSCIEILGYQTNAILAIKSFRKKYYSTVCAHALSPLLSFTSFLDLCLKVYIVDFEYRYNDKLIRQLSKSLQNKFKLDEGDDDVKFGSKIYQIRIGIKSLAVDYVDILKNIIEEIFDCLDKIYNNIRIETDDYVKNCVSRWWNDKILYNKIDIKKCKGERKEIVDDYININPRYIIRNGKAYLYIPSFRINDYEGFDPILELSVNGNKSDVSPRFNVVGEVIPRTEELLIDLNNLFKDKINLEVTITIANKVIYEENCKFNRDFIIFKGNKEVRGEILNEGTYSIFTPNITLIKKNVELYQSYRYLYNFYAKKGNFIQFNKTHIIFSNYIKINNIDFNCNVINGFLYEYNGEKYKIIKSDLFMKVDKEVRINELVVKFNGSTQELKIFSCDEDDNEYVFNLTQLIYALKPFKIEVVNIVNSKTINSINIIKINDFEYSFDKDLYYDEHGKINTFIASADGQTYKGSFILDDSDSRHIRFAEGYLNFNPPIMRWRVSGDDHYNYSPKTVYKDLFSDTSEIIIDFNDKVNLKMLSTRNNEIANLNGNFCFGKDMISAISNKNLAEITYFLEYKKHKYEILRIYLKPTLDENSIKIYPEKKIIVYEPIQYGLDSKLLSIYLYQNDKEVFCKQVLSKVKTIINISSLDANIYNLKITVNLSIFQKTETILLDKKNILLGNTKEIKYLNKKLLFSLYMPFKENEPKQLNHFYIDNIRYLKTIDDFDIYSGNLYIIRDNVKKYINQFNHGGEVVAINPIRLEMLTDCTCYLGYGLKLDDEDYDYDDEFTINKNSSNLSIGTRNYINVDYFYYKVLEDD